MLHVMHLNKAYLEPELNQKLIYIDQLKNVVKAITKVL